MRLTENFFDFENRRPDVLSYLSGRDITRDDIGIDIPLLESWTSKPYSSFSSDHVIVYNGFTISYVGNWETQVIPQIERYLKEHRGDIVDDILED